ncbi:hypothetical protein [Roseobacter sp. SK209-2-6]|uniref:hypothetical protein n=1 Tax=Roseobacter sp. SK209-2-6 TaxID=388739 RepID=UPI0002E2F835|nr:hypothetical protein [Roseobacter sp. SK209-2-6]
MMQNTLKALSLSVLLALPAGAQAFTTARGVQVNPLTDLVFEVIPSGSGDLAGFWCGASEYARRELGAGWTDKVYVLRERGPSETTGRRSAVHFTLYPEQTGVGPAPQGWLRFGIKAGDRMSIQSARRHCDQSIVEER